MNSNINILFDKERKMKNNKLQIAIFAFYFMLIGIIIGYAWRMYHERLDIKVSTSTPASISEVKNRFNN